MRLYEAEFSARMIIKSNYRSALKNSRDTLHPAILDIQPRFIFLRKNEQAIHLMNIQIFF